MADRKTFAQGVEELVQWVGDGPLVGHVVVDQSYAHFQHEAADVFVVPLSERRRDVFTKALDHPHGGGPNYLGGPLFTHMAEYLAALALSILPGYQRPVDAMMDNMEDLAGSGGVATHAPTYFGDLRQSGHPFVTENDVVTRDRAPLAPRRSDETENELWTLPSGEWRWD